MSSTDNDHFDEDVYLEYDLEDDDFSKREVDRNQILATTSRQKPHSLLLDLPISSACWGADDNSVNAITNNGRIFSRARTPKSRLEYNHAGNRFAILYKSKRILTYSRSDLWIWSMASGSLIQHLDFADPIIDVAASPDEKSIAIRFGDGTVSLAAIDPFDWYCHIDGGYYDSGDRVRWTDANHIAVLYEPSSLHVHDCKSGALVDYLDGTHSGYAIKDLQVFPDGRILSAGADRTIRLWSPKLQLIDIYECPTGHPITGLSTSVYRGRPFFAALDESPALHIFEPSARRLLKSIVAEPRSYSNTENSAFRFRSIFLGFAPGGRRIGVTAYGEKTVLTWSLATILKSVEQGGSQYRNSKVVVVGDTGVGKSGLALRLSSQPFAATESSHGRNIWTADRTTINLPQGGKELREVLLWDLAGQPGYRLFHRLSLHDVAVGLVLFDARSESEPFKGVSYWAKALDNSSSSSEEHHVAKLLVSSRIDRGTLSVSNERVADVVRAAGFDGFFETSAKTNEGVADLRSKILESIDWDSIPVVVAPNIFGQIRDFLLRVKKTSEILVESESNLQEMFVNEFRSAVNPQIFSICLQRLETAGLILHVSFGDSWVLQPEILDSYVAWLAQAARREPDGLGAIRESDAVAGNYPHEPRNRISDETVILMTAVEEVVFRGLTVRVATEQGQMLVFPSELRTDLPDYPQGFNLELAFSFAGPVPAVYSAITVRLINSIVWGRRYDLFQGAAVFRVGDSDEMICGLAAHFAGGDEAAEGKITVFFGSAVGRDQKLSFLRYIDYQLQQMAVEDSIVRQRLYNCCGIAIDGAIVAARVSRGEHTVICGVCGRYIPMDDLADRTAIPDQSTREAQEQALTEQGRQQRLSTFTARTSRREFDTFVCYNSLDRRQVVSLYDDLTAEGALCWMDKKRTEGGRTVGGQLERAIDSVSSAVLAWGPSSMGPWQEQEYYAFLNRAVSRRPDSRPLSLIPVLLPGAAGHDDLPVFARTYPTIDLRRGSVSEFQKLVKWIFSPRLAM